MSPNGTVLFYITPDPINEMLHFKPNHPLTPLSMKQLLDQGSKLSSAEIGEIANLFMRPDSQPRGSPPYHQVYSLKLEELS